MPLNLSAYASDSDDDQPRKLATATPDASMSHAVSGGTSVALTVPAKRKPTSRGKLQFHVPAHLGNTPEEAEDGQTITATSFKRPKLDGSARPTHSLFSSLPAPKRHDLELESRREEEPEEPATGAGTNGDDAREQPLPDVRHTKSNSAFRQMLGLPPGADDHNTSISNRPSQDTMKSRQNTRLRIAGDLRTSSKGADLSDSVHVADDALRSTVEKTPVAYSRRVPSLSAAPDPDADTPQQSESAPVEAADSVDDLYEGWQRNPDGTWAPVTPEAIAAYQHHIQNELNTSLRDAGQAEQEDMPTFNVNFTLQDPSQSQTSGAEQTAQQRSTHRARHKGQLSSLVNLAAERKTELEGKWTRQKSGTASSARKYGF